ncbi:MAG TPA: hypothetical protein VJR89_37775 [Polyangiales bacterium]|nr:hypothetical protein [Polyangiales bacterium]
MTAAILYGAGSGALHAVTGPDHVLSLGPVALQHPRASFRIGLGWGVGHAIGTLLLALPLLVLSGFVHLSAFAAWGERAAGFALLAAAGFSFWSARNAAAGSADVRRPLVVGIVHGATGAGSLLLLLPVLVAGSLLHTVLFLAAFSIGSTLAMAALTTAIAKLGARCERSTIQRAQRGMLIAACLLGVYWLV